MAQRKTLNKDLRAALISTYGGNCQYCGAPGASDLDHVVPLARGGKDDISNMVLACSLCNRRKRDGLIAEPLLALMSAIAERHAARARRWAAKPGAVRDSKIRWERYDGIFGDITLIAHPVNVADYTPAHLHAVDRLTLQRAEDDVFRCMSGYFDAVDRVKMLESLSGPERQALA